MLMKEKMRLMSEEAKSLQVADEVLKRIVARRKDEVQCVEKMRRVEDIHGGSERQAERGGNKGDEGQNVKMSPEDEVGRKATREGRGCAGLVQGGDEMHRVNETCSTGRAKGTEEKENMEE